MIQLIEDKRPRYSLPVTPAWADNLAHRRRRARNDGGRPLQKMYFKANWTTRPGTEAVVIWPKVEELRSLTG